MSMVAAATASPGARPPRDLPDRNHIDSFVSEGSARICEERVLIESKSLDRIDGGCAPGRNIAGDQPRSGKRSSDGRERGDIVSADAEQQRPKCGRRGDRGDNADAQAE